MEYTDRHYCAQPGSFALPLPHARVPPPMLGRIVMCWPCSIPTPLTRAAPASSSGDSGSPASRSAVPELAVVDEHMSCAREHTSHECHGHQQPRDRGVRMGLVRGSVPDGRGRPRGCRWLVRPTGGPSSSSCARSGRSCAARHGLRDRLSEPVQIMCRPDSRLCVRCGRPKAEQAEEIIVPCSNDRSSHPTPGGKNFFG